MQYGFFLFSSSNNTLSNNIASRNGQDGILIDGISSNNVLNGNEVIPITTDGFSVLIVGFSVLVLIFLRKIKNP